LRSDNGGATVRIDDLDLNLLVSLDALLRERSVSRAAVFLSRSQPALSAALARLRDHYHDELLRRVGNQYELTPFATQLLERTGPALASIERVFSIEPDFVPERSDREFRIAMPDEAHLVLLPALERYVRKRAPDVKIRVVTLTGELATEAHQALRSIDAMVLPHGMLSGLPYADLYDDRWVCVASSDNPRIGDSLTREIIEACPMVLTHHRPTGSPGGRPIREAGIEPNWQISTESFLALPALVTGTDRIALIPERLARIMPNDGSFRILELPFDSQPITIAMWWHPINEQDPGHAWMREMFILAGRTLRQTPA
jgi:DNA-binding transcriptional LysR family regulator